MFDATAPILFLMNDKSEEEKQEAFKAVMQSRNIPALAFFEKQLKKVKGDFIAGYTFNIADCCMVSAIANLFENPALKGEFTPVIEKKFPVFQKYIRRLKRMFKVKLEERFPPPLKPKLESGPFGRADPIRYLLYEADIEFDDVTISGNEWVQRWASGKGGEFNCLPILTFDGKELGQPSAILRKLGVQYGFYDIENISIMYQTDIVLDVFEDAMTNMHKLRYQQGDEESKHGAVLQAIEKIHKPALRVFEDQMEDHLGPHIAGENITIADFCIVAMIKSIWRNPKLEYAFTPILEDYPGVSDYLGRIQKEVL